MFVFLGHLENVKFLIEHGATDNILKVKDKLCKLKSLKPSGNHREHKANQDKWNSVLDFLECFQLKQDADKCRDPIHDEEYVEDYEKCL